jgi:hypothetical protein
MLSLCKLGTFSSTREHMNRDAWVKMARQSKYKVLFLPTLNARQKEFWDKRERRKEQQAKK